MRISARTRWLLVAEMAALTTLLVGGAVLTATATGGQLIGESLIFLVMVVALLAPLAAWAHTDMEARGHNGVAYALAIGLMPPVGLIAWLLMRRSPR